MNMNRMRLVLPIVLLLLPAGLTAAQDTAKLADDDVLMLIREEGLEHSQVMDYLSWMTDVFGGRLTGSPALDQATDWALETFSEMGLQNVHKEAWGPFGRGWTVEHFNLQAKTPYGTIPLAAYPKAWSPGTDGHVSGDVVLVQAETPEDLEQYRGKLAGKIVLMQGIRETEEPFEPLATRRNADNLLQMANAVPSAAAGNARRRYSSEMMARFRFQREVTNFVLNEKPAAILDRGRLGDYGTLFVSSASVPSPPDAGFFGGPRIYDLNGPETVPQLTVAVEQYNRLIRIMDKGIPVTADVMMKVSFDESDPMEYNIIGEIPGTDPQIGDQVVMVGGHFDSWHSGTGATDNGAGSAVMMEVMRILRTVFAEGGNTPRRTIRIGLWTGEEQGLLGSRAYVSQHFAESEGRGQPPTVFKPEYEKLSAYYNLDNGTGKIRGVYLQGNTFVESIFRDWLVPFHELGAATLTLNNTGGTDHLSFDGVGLPGFQFIQEPISYSTKTHHSNMDVYDHTIPDDLKQAATIIASFAYNTAQRDEMMPRKPLPAAHTQTNSH